MNKRMDVKNYQSNNASMVNLWQGRWGVSNKRDTKGGGTLSDFGSESKMRGEVGKKQRDVTVSGILVMVTYNKGLGYMLTGVW